MRVLPVALLPLLAAAQINYVRDSQIDRVAPPSFEVANTSVSFMMNCRSADCFFVQSGAKTIFDKGLLTVRIGTAINAASLAARQEANVNNAVEASFTFNAAENFAIDRVVQLTDPDASVTVESFRIPPNVGQNSADWEYTPTTERNFWNAFIRFRLIDVPTEVLDRMDEVLTQVDTLYGGGAILFDSVWVERDSFFITDQLEPVPGRGHKDQQLLIPLFCGIAAMLIIPAVVSWCLVQRSEVHRRGQRVEKRLTRRVEVLADDLVTKNAIVEQSRENAEAREAEHQHEEEMQRLRDATELEYNDVDWKAKPPAQTPY